MFWREYSNKQRHKHIIVKRSINKSNQRCCCIWSRISINKATRSFQCMFWREYSNKQRHKHIIVKRSINKSNQRCCCIWSRISINKATRSYQCMFWMEYSNKQKCILFKRSTKSINNNSKDTDILMLEVSSDKLEYSLY